MKAIGGWRNVQQGGDEGMTQNRGWRWVCRRSLGGGNMCGT